MRTSFPVLGYDIGGTKVAVCLGTSAGRIIASKRVPSNGRGPDEVMPEMIAAGHDLLADAEISTGELRAIGVCAPGPMDIPNGMLLPSPNMKNWGGVPIRDQLAETFGKTTYFENDANAGALAEWFFGAGKGCSNIIYLTMSTGIGGGVIVEGKLLHGVGCQAGELGHIILDPEGPDCNCGLRGCYEAFCGGRAVAQRLKHELSSQPENPIVKHAGAIDKIDYLAFEKAVRDGDPYARARWDEIAIRHAQAIGALAMAFNPEKIILGTIAWAAGDLFMKPLNELLPHYCWPEVYRDLNLTVSGLGREIGEFAGISVALYGLQQNT